MPVTAKFKILMSATGDGNRPAAAQNITPLFTVQQLCELEGTKLGKDAFGSMYLIKGYPNLLIKEIRLDAIDEDILRSIEFELVTIPKLSHPGVIKYHQVLKDGNIIFIVMDRYDDCLDQLVFTHIKKCEPIPSDIIYSVTIQVVDALVYVHSAQWVDEKGKTHQGIAHRDIKPANICISEDGNHFILAGFDICKDNMRDGMTYAGSPAYMAPETLIRKKTSTASDIWGLGVTIYEMAALKRPNFLGDKEPKDVFVDGWKPDLSAIQDDFIRGMLERIFVLDPAKRPTAKELSELLRAHRDSRKS